PGLQEERKDLLSMAGGGRAVREVPARFVEVVEALAMGEYDGFHFSGHSQSRGPDADRSAILLDHGDELRPEHRHGELRNVGRTHQPLVFLNACSSARGGISLVQVGGWAHGWLKVGAGAFVGAYWRVQDKPARAFSQAFYREVRAGRTVGAA